MTELDKFHAVVKNLPSVSSTEIQNRTDNLFPDVRAITERIFSERYPEEHQQLKALRTLTQDDSLFKLLVDQAFALGVAYANAKGGR